MNALASPFATVGKSIPRIDAALKVSGHATYTADHNLAGALFAVPVTATIASGEIDAIDSSAAETMPGVQAIYTNATIGTFYRLLAPSLDTAYVDEMRPPLDDDTIRYYGQYVALVVADTLEQAVAAAHAVSVTYRTRPHDVTSELSAEKLEVVSERGDAAAGFAAGAVQIDQTYGTPDEVHNPIEAHATVATWDGDRVTLYETSQAVMNQQQVMSEMLGVPKDNVRVVTRFLGSGFGGKLWPWTHSLLAARAAQKLNRPVKLVLDRKAMFSTVGHRPRTSQRIRLAATRDAKLTSLQHDYVNQTSILDDYVENCGEATPFLYSVPNLKVTSGLAHKNVGTPTSMRGPGAVPGLYALESAMDELAIALQVDPVELRRSNEPELDESLGIPFSSRHLRECLTEGGGRFGWEKRNPVVGSMRRDGLILGWGMAAASWIAARYDCEIALDLRSDGTMRVISGTQDIGTGTYTMLAQIAGEFAGVDPSKVEVVIGDSDLPPGPTSGGSMVTASLIPALQAAVTDAGSKLLLAAVAKGGPFEGKTPDELVFEAGTVKRKGASSDGVPFGDILVASRIKAVRGEGKSEGNFAEVLGTKKAVLSSHSFACHFAEVTWEPEIARLRVSRIVSAIDAGRMINPRTARNQIEGAVVMGVGMAMFEQMSFDQRSGAPINSNLADYIVATHADAPELEVIFVEYPDYNLNALGARGVGEIGLAGTPAAITNAIYHATGRRVRQLPVRIEDLL